MLEKKEYEVLLKDLFGTIEYSGEKEDIEKAYSELTKKQKDAVLWRTKGLTFNKVGRKLNISQTAARTHYFHALQRIRRAIENRTFTNGDISVDTDIWCLKLSTRSRNVLLRNKCRTVGDVSKLSYEELRNLKFMGTKSANEIISLLHSYNITLKGELPLVVPEDITEQTSILQLELPTKIKNILIKEGYKIVGDLIASYIEDLYSIKGLGLKTVDCIVQCISTSKLHFKTKPITNVILDSNTLLSQDSLNYIYAYCKQRTELEGCNCACLKCQYRGVNGFNCMFKEQPRNWSVTEN